jgi:nitrate reductase beta subunit
MNNLLFIISYKFEGIPQIIFIRAMKSAPSVRLNSNHSLASPLQPKARMLHTLAAVPQLEGIVMRCSFSFLL